MANSRLLNLAERICIQTSELREHSPDAAVVAEDFLKVFSPYPLAPGQCITVELTDGSLLVLGAYQHIDPNVSTMQVSRDDLTEVTSVIGWVPDEDDPDTVIYVECYSNESGAPLTRFQERLMALQIRDDHPAFMQQGQSGTNDCA